MLLVRRIGVRRVEWQVWVCRLLLLLLRLLLRLEMSVLVVIGSLLVILRMGIWIMG